MSIGLIVTELVMNALKHAFPDEKPDAAIVVSYKVAGTDWKLTVSDNGIGKPDVSAGDTKPGLGTSLVKALTRQLDAVVEIASDHAARPYPSRTRPSKRNRPRRTQCCRPERGSLERTPMLTRTHRETVTFQ